MEDSDVSMRVFVHDLRNYLGAISNYSQVLELSLQQKRIEEAKFAKEINAAISHIEELVRRHFDAGKSRSESRRFAMRALG